MSLSPASLAVFDRNTIESKRRKFLNAKKHTRTLRKAHTHCLLYSLASISSAFIANQLVMRLFICLNLINSVVLSGHKLKQEKSQNLSGRRGKRMTIGAMIIRWTGKFHFKECNDRIASHDLRSQRLTGLAWGHEIDALFMLQSGAQHPATRALLLLFLLPQQLRESCGSWKFGGPKNRKQN